MSNQLHELKCPYCDSREITHGMQLRLGNPLTDVGLMYDQGVLFSAVEPLRMNLCKECGTVVRMYVENPKRKWD